MKIDVAKIGTFSETSKLFERNLSFNSYFVPQSS